jgi:predicted house-cleaning NTP pyrophosphatase (Maf/HAM1 superfamily)
LIAVKEIRGSYTNVIGLPTQRINKELQKLKLK